MGAEKSKLKDKIELLMQRQKEQVHRRYMIAFLESEKNDFLKKMAETEAKQDAEMLKKDADKYEKECYQVRKDYIRIADEILELGNLSDLELKYNSLERAENALEEAYRIDCQQLEKMKFFL